MKTYNGRLHPEDKGVPSLFNEALRRSHESFSSPDDVPEEMCVGLVVARHFEWDGHAIMWAFQSALSDANFHTEARQVREWIKTSVGDMKVVDG